jgi:tetratricopeptide (TPR) repeat protein
MTIFSRVVWPIRPTWRACRQTALLIGIVLCAGRIAGAQTLEDQARRLFKEGNALYEKKDYEGALGKFRQAKAIYPSYKIDVNIGTTLSALGRDTEAAEHYEHFLQRADKIAPRDLVKEVAGSLDELRLKLGRVEVSCPVAGSAVEVDGKHSGTTPLGAPIYVSPGKHVLAAKKQGYQPYEVSIEAIAGQQTRIDVPWKTVEPAAVAAKTVDLTSGQAAAAPAERSWKWTVGLVGVGVGGATLLTGIIFGALAKGKSSDYKTAVDTQKTYDELNSIEDKGKSYNAIGIALMVSGGVIAAAGGGLLLWHYLGKPWQSERARAEITPLLGLGHAGIAAAWRFE